VGLHEKKNCVPCGKSGNGKVKGEKNPERSKKGSGFTKRGRVKRSGRRALPPAEIGLLGGKVTDRDIGKKIRTGERKPRPATTGIE